MAPPTADAEDAPAGEQRLRETSWHAVDGAGAAERLGVDPDRGLDAKTVKERRSAYGPNELPRAEHASLPRVFLRQFADPLIYVLLVAGIVSVAIGNVADAAFILAVLLLNAGLGTWQEYNAEHTAAALEEAMTVRATVLRDGAIREVDATELVPGDVVELASGAAVPADLRLLSAEELRADESLLTGESVPVGKDPGAELDDDVPTAEQATLAFAGTNVVSGRGRGVVVRTGAGTEIGAIARSLGQEGGAPPLVVRMRRFTRQIALAIVAVVLVLGAAQFLRGVPPVELFFLAVALAVSAIPAGLPVAITVALSIASGRMADRSVVVRKLPAVEGLGACTIIATDKTGTLTENRLTAERLRPTGEEDVTVTGTGRETGDALRRGGTTLDLDDEEAVRRLVRSGALCNEGRLEETGEGLEGQGDTVDVALLVLARTAGLERERLDEAAPERGRIPFESERKFAASFREEEGRVVAHVKGAADAVAAMCAVDADAVRADEEALAAEGYRVLAVACGEVDRATADEADPDALSGLSFLGLVGLIDPVRAEVHDAVARARSAGIDVCMITGDHPSTGLAIARELGFADEDDEAITGPELAADQEDEAGLLERVRRARVFARVEPLQKTRIVELLQDAGHFVAVTGDGVNDAPALRRAHIGVAMGRGGTDVARDAADLILTNDDFASIVDGVAEGRVAYDNVRKVVWLLMSTAVAEIVLFVLAVAFDTPMPLTPVQLLWLNLVTNGVQDVALAFEGGEPGVLDRRPRRPDEPIFDRLMREEVLGSGLYMGVVAFAVFQVLLGPFGMETFDARNLLVLLLVLFENVHVFNVRSEARSAFGVPLAANRLLVLGVLLAQGLHIGSMFVPGWRDVLAIAPVSPQTWAVLLAITLSKFAVVELYKALRGRRLFAESHGLTAPAAA